MSTVASENSTIVRTGFTLKAVGMALRTLDFVAPRVASRVAADVFLTPRKRKRPERESEWAAHAVRAQGMLAGLPLVSWKWESQNGPVLLLHGWEGRGTQMGGFALALRRNGLASIAPDFPAHGDSPGHRTNLLEFAAVIAELISTHRPPAIVAHSFAAPATMLALRDTQFTGRLVFIAPPEDFSFFTSTFSSMLGIPQELGRRMQKEVETRFSIDWSQMRGTALAKQMTAPLLVLHDRSDRDVPHTYGEALAAAWPGAELKLTSGLGHHRILREASVIDEALRFIAG